MKRFILALAAILLLSWTQVHAQARFGVTGGVGWNNHNFKELVKQKPDAGWNAGITLAVDLPLGFSLQPTLLYHQKNAYVTNAVGQRMGFVELPVSVQWGPDLLVFRPFLDVTPYVGYALSNETYVHTHYAYPAEWTGVQTQTFDKDTSWKGKQRFEYGLGLGGGIEVWRFQVVVRYNWNFGQLYNVKEWDDIKDHLGDLKAESDNFSGVSLGLSFFF